MKTHTIAIIVLIFLSFISYINIYQNEFISDDLEGIVKSETISDLSHNLKTLTPPNIVLSATYQISKLNPALYHFVCIFLHTANTILIYILILQIAPKDIKNKLALFTSTIFAVHTIHVEVVAWISAISYLILTFCNLSAIILFIHYVNYKKIYALILSVFLFILSIMSSEKATPLPLILATYLYSFKSIKSNLFPLSIFFIVILFYGLTFTTRLPERITAINPSYAEGTRYYNPILQTSMAVSSYLSLIAVPINLTLYHDASADTKINFAIRIFVTITYFLATIYLYKKNRLLFFASSMFFFGILVTLIPISVGWVVAERYIYFGSSGIILIFAYIIIKLGEKVKFKELSYIILACILSAYLILTLNRNAEWKSGDTLWPATVKISPQNPLARNNMGDYYARKGDYDSAIKEFSMAIRLKAGMYPEAIHNLANSYLDKKEATSAAKLYLAAIELKPSQSESYIQLAKTYYLYLNNPKEAENILIKGVNTIPEDPTLNNALGVVYAENKDFEKASHYFQKAASLDPNFQNALLNLERLKNSTQ